MKVSGRSWGIVAAAYALALILAFTYARPVPAQQGQFRPPPKVPVNQGQSRSTLELPTTPGRQGVGTKAIPRFEPQPKGEVLTIPSRQLRAHPGYEQVTVTVTDQHGRYITNLQKSDFRLYIDGQQRPIDFFRQDLNTPVSLGILVDTSGSMQPKLTQARAAITEFINALNDRDDVFLFAFSTKPFLLQPFTTGHQQVIARLPLLHAFGRTALFDTILSGLIMVQNGRWDKKALLVVTDGMDNSSAATVGKVVQQARLTGVLVYSIGIGESAPARSMGPFIVRGEGDQVDAQTLNTLSTETGAKTFLLREMGDGAAMRNACATISRELREQYTLGFVVPDVSRGGYRDLRVTVPTHPEEKLRVRKGVAVGRK